MDHIWQDIPIQYGRFTYKNFEYDINYSSYQLNKIYVCDTCGLILLTKRFSVYNEFYKFVNNDILLISHDGFENDIKCDEYLLNKILL